MYLRHVLVRTHNLLTAVPTPGLIHVGVITVSETRFINCVWHCRCWYTDKSRANDATFNLPVAKVASRVHRAVGPTLRHVCGCRTKIMYNLTGVHLAFAALALQQCCVLALVRYESWQLMVELMYTSRVCVSGSQAGGWYLIVH